MEKDTSIQPVEDIEIDNLIIDLFAEGHTLPMVKDALAAKGWELTEHQIRYRKKRNNTQIIRRIAENTDKLLKNIPEGYKPVRVRQVVELCERLRAGVEECAALGQWSTAAKLADTLLKAYRYIAEETHDLSGHGSTMNFYVQILQQAPPEIKGQIISKLQELQAMIQAAGLGDMKQKAVDAEFTTDDE